jgi:hypothetical protein
VLLLVLREKNAIEAPSVPLIVTGVPEGGLFETGRLTLTAGPRRSPAAGRNWPEKRRRHRRACVSC